MKTRSITEARHGILWPLNTKRHFGSMRTVYKDDIKWSRKVERLVWRGADTGEGSRFRILEPFLVAEYEDIDVGMSNILGYANKSFVRRILQQDELLAYKYLLCLEGNDVASGLKWMLMSNSVVFMPSPTKHSWALESLLKPYIHYIPVSDDLKDLQSQIDWAKRNDRLAELISKRASHFIEPFISLAMEEKSETEMKIQSDIARAYTALLRQITDEDSSKCRS